jgi:GNAT superfamily N-acetyltransferase
MTLPAVTLRTMTPAEYRAATEHREAESVRVLARTMAREEALERVRRGTARFLPDGLDTAGHHLLTAVDEADEAVGTAWAGPDPGGTAGAAWLYDLHVFEPFRRRGYGSAILAAVESLVAEAGLTALGLNVVGDNEAAIALYRRSGYGVSSMAMRKPVVVPLAALEPLRAHFRSPDGVFDVGPGWRRLVLECHRAVVAEFPGYDLVAVKQKWAALAFQAFPRPWRSEGDFPGAEYRRLGGLIDPFVKRSRAVCERCGAVGTLRTGRRIELTLCEECELLVPLHGRI